MRPKLLAMTALVASGVIATAFLVQSLSSSSAQTPARQLPQYTASGDLILPKDFHEWVYVGSPLTPNALNGGEAGFPEYPRTFQWRRRDGQGYQALCRFGRLGLLQFQSS